MCRCRARRPFTLGEGVTGARRELVEDPYVDLGGKRG
jgi:hypothetical protein